MVFLGSGVVPVSAMLAWSGQMEESGSAETYFLVSGSVSHRSLPDIATHVPAATTPGLWEYAIFTLPRLIPIAGG